MSQLAQHNLESAWAKITHLETALKACLYLLENPSKPSGFGWMADQQDQEAKRLRVIALAKEALK